MAGTYLATLLSLVLLSEKAGAATNDPRNEPNKIRLMTLPASFRPVAVGATILRAQLLSGAELHRSGVDHPCLKNQNMGRAPLFENQNVGRAEQKV